MRKKKKEVKVHAVWNILASNLICKWLHAGLGRTFQGHRNSGHKDTVHNQV